MPQHQYLTDSTRKLAKVLLSNPDNFLLIQTLLGRRSKDLLSKIVAKYGLTPTQYELLYGLLLCPDCNQSQLGSFLFLDNASITRQVEILEEGGYLIRGRSRTDRRSITLKLSNHSEVILPQIEQLIRNMRVELLEGISRKQKEALMESFVRLHDNLANTIDYEF